METETYNDLDFLEKEIAAKIILIDRRLEEIENELKYLNTKEMDIEKFNRLSIEQYNLVVQRETIEWVLLLLDMHYDE